MTEATGKTSAPSPTDYRASADTSIGHVHLRVSNLERSIRFREGVLGFALQARLGDQAAFLGARLADGEGELVYHHHIGLNVWESRGGAPAPRDHLGRYHAAILYPDRAALAAAVCRV